MTTKPRPRILILGDPEEGTFEKDLYQFLNEKERYAESNIKPKNSMDLLKEAETADLIVMFFRDSSEESRKESEQILPHLRDRADRLLLFAENSDQLLEVVNNMGIRAYRLFKLTSEIDWQKRLLEAILDWVPKEPPPAVIVPEPATGPVPEKDKPAGWLSNFAIAGSIAEGLKSYREILAIVSAAVLALATLGTSLGAVKASDKTSAVQRSGDYVLEQVAGAALGACILAEDSRLKFAGDRFRLDLSLSPTLGGGTAHLSGNVDEQERLILDPLVHTDAERDILELLGIPQVGSSDPERLDLQIGKRNHLYWTPSP